MPLINSTGALKQQRSFVTTPISGGQWLAQFANTAISTIPQVQPMPSGDIFVVSDSKLIKLTSSGSKTFANLLSGYQEAFCLCADSSNNLYVGGLIDNYPAVIKYDSSGNITWQLKLSTSAYSPITSIQVATNGDVFALLGSQMPISGSYVPYTTANTIWKISSNGTVLNQRKTLKASTSFLECLFIDNTNSKLYVAGTEWVGTDLPTKVILGSYGLSNTDVAETLVTATRSTNSLYIGGSPYDYKTMVSDGTYIYQLVYIGGGGSNILKINKTTGATSYFYFVSSAYLNGITMDNAGYMYIMGNSNSSSDGYGIVMKVRMSDGVIIWSKKIGTSTVTLYQITWSDGYVYVTASKTAFGYSSICIKMKDDGNITSGTYGGWAFANLTHTTSTPFTPTTATATGNNTTTAYTNSALTYTQTTASVTVTTTTIS